MLTGPNSKPITTFFQLFADLVVIVCAKLSIYLGLSHQEHGIDNPVVYTSAAQTLLAVADQLTNRLPIT